MSENVQCVVNHPDGWAVRSGGAKRASSVHCTLAEAITVARWTVMRMGGGEVIVEDRRGKSRKKETVSCPDDPIPPQKTGWWRAFWRVICRGTSDT